MFGAFKKRLSGSVAKFSGKKDFLEAVCAACALVAAADGNVSDDEVATTIKTILAHPDLSGAFPSREIETTADAMLKRAAAGRSGRMGLYKEIDDIANDADMSETVYVTALDVAEADGSIGDKEKEVLAKIASSLKVDTKKFDV